MEDKIITEITNFIAKKYANVSKIIANLDSDKSEIIEIIGQRGSGKSHLFKEIIKNLADRKALTKYYIPSIYKYNHFRELLKLITTIDDATFDELIKQSLPYEFTNRFDLFYFLTENLKKKNKFRALTVVIYESYNLDKYTIDFLQYITQYLSEANINFIIFTRKETYPFSIKEEIELLSVKDIETIIKKVFDGKQKDFTSESEIIYNISRGNLFIVQYLLKNYFSKNDTLDVESSYLGKKIDFSKIYKQEIEKFDKLTRDVLFSILLLGFKATKTNLKNIFSGKNIAKKLKILSNKQFILKLEEHYYVKKLGIVKTYAQKLDTNLKNQIINYLNKYDEITLKLLLKKADSAEVKKIAKYLYYTKDFGNLITIYQKQLKKTESKTDKYQILQHIGLINKKLNNFKAASENFRQSLKIALKQSLPSQEIIYNLAQCLYKINSSQFALEIIKKYSPESITNYWKIKILLLKVKILIDRENFIEAQQVIGQTYKLISREDDRNTRLNLQAEANKTEGLINYYSNELKKAERNFEEAEKLYKDTQNIEGLAAIYNNLGGLYIFKGKWEKTETLMLKSLEYEEKRYNLNGIAYCYNNLGSLFGDKSDYKKALYYLNKALKIQKLLNDRYQIAVFYFNIGLTYKDFGDFKKAEANLKKSLQISITFNMFKNVDAALNALGALYFKYGDWPKAIEYYKRAIEKSKSNNFYEGLCQSYNNLGEIHEKKGEFNVAYDFYSKSKELLPKFSDDFLEAHILGNLGSVLTSLHKFGEAYPYLVESYEFFKKIDALEEIVEGAHKLVKYFIETHNLESGSYYLDQAYKISEQIQNDYLIGKSLLLKAYLNKNKPDEAKKCLTGAIEKFVKTGNTFDLTMANYQLAVMNNEKGDWEQAIEILTDNKKLLEKFNAIRFLEKNNVLLKKIRKEHAAELQEAKHQESILNDFYEITQNLNEIEDINLLLEEALSKLISFSQADGGIFCLYPNESVKYSWDYVILNNIATEDDDFPAIMKMINKAYTENTNLSHKQPHFAPEINHIISFPLSIRDEKRGVITLFSNAGAKYFTENNVNLLSALCNQIVVIIDNITFKNLKKSHDIIREELSSDKYYTNIIGKSEEIEKIYQMIEKIKDTPTTVLLEGPSGTGKELIARAIHFESNRKNKKFIAQYCGALPETLLESELFGHVKGSFTGASKDKKGLFEVADGGTFFLDEIADISLSTQAKLLRFLQDGEIKRVGSTVTKTVDVRVICATNVSLKQKVEEGSFREDLYYRLNVIKIDIPSLKERSSDIPLLAVHFLDKYSKKIGKNVKGITDEAMKYLMQYTWPGNIRQLENEIERAVTLADEDSYINSSDLSDEIFKFKRNTEMVELLENQSIKDAVKQLEKKMILDALDENDWNQTQSAKQLGLSRQGLIKKMKRYKLKELRKKDK